MGAVVTWELELSTHLAGAWASESTPVWGTAPEFEDCILTHFVVHNKSLSFYAWEICSFQQSFVLQRDEETWRALHDNKQMSHYLNYLAKSGGKRALSFAFMCNWGTSSALRDHFAGFVTKCCLYNLKSLYIISCTLL